MISVERQKISVSFHIVALQITLDCTSSWIQEKMCFFSQICLHSYSCKPLAHKWFVWGRSLLKINQLGNELKEIYVKFQQTWRTEKWIMKGTKWEKCWFWCWLAADLAITALLSDHWENNQIFGNSQNSGWVWKHDTSYKKAKASHIQQTW